MYSDTTNQAAPQLTAEQKIRDAFRALPSVTLGNQYPIVVEHNGRKREFLACQKKLASGTSHAIIHLAVIVPGKELYFDEVKPMVQFYKLNGKNELTAEGGRAANESDMLQWKEGGFTNPMDKLRQKTPEEKAIEQSYVQAKSIAVWSRGNGDLIEAGRNQSFEGAIIEVTEHHVVQHIGRVAAIHLKNNLDVVPSKDQLATITYQGLDKARVEVKNLQTALDVER